METIETTATNGEQQTVRATVDQRAFFKSMRHLFASSFSVMGELVQNGRRAQATKIAITCDEAARLITVSDDGVGIDNFDVLLDLARSGWESAEVQLVDKPFGMGFFACAFAAQSVKVYSKGKRLVFSQDDVIEQRALSVQEQSEEERAAMGEWTTRIELVGASRDLLGSQQQVHFKTHSFETRIHHLVCGFPLPVTYNGTPLAQHASLPALRDVCEATSIGHVHAVFMHAKPTRAAELTPAHANNTALYLQGLPIEAGPFGFNTHGSISYIVHLDSSQFTARMPDRSHLYDRDKNVARIWEEVGAVIRRHIVSQKDVLDPQDFVRKYWNPASKFNIRHVFNDVPFMPRREFLDVNTVAINTDYTDVLSHVWEGLGEDGEALISYEDVKSGAIKVWRNAPGCVQEDPWAATLLKVMQVADIRSVNAQHEEHWINRIAPDSADMQFEVQLETPGAKSVDYCWQDCNANIREAAAATVIVTSKVDPAWCEEHRIENNWLFVPDGETLEAVDAYGAGDHNYDAWLLGNSEQAQDHPVNALATFTDDNHYVEDWEEDAKRDWDLKVGLLRDSHLSETIGRLLVNTWPQFSDRNLGQISIARARRNHIGAQRGDDEYGDAKLDLIPMDDNLIRAICQQLKRTCGVQVSEAQLGDAIWHAVKPGELHGGPLDGAFYRHATIVNPNNK